LSTAIRTALGETFGGDSSLFKALFALPQTFDARIMSILSGLAINIDAPTSDDLAMISNLRLLMKEIDSTSQTNRIAFIDALKAFLALSPSVVDTTNVSGHLIDMTSSVHLVSSSSSFLRVAQLQAKVFSFSLRLNFASGSGCTVGHVPGWGISLGGFSLPAENAFFAAVVAYGGALELPSNSQGAATPQHMTVESTATGYGFTGLLFRNVPTTSFASTDPALQSATISGTLIFP
jgi:hypothetical protein